MDILITDSRNTKKLEDGNIQLTDANNKVFNININDIVNAETFESGIDDLSDSSNLNINFSVDIKDSEGNILDEDNLISQVKSGEASALDVTFESTHTGKNKNYVVYTSDSLEKDTPSWMSPFKKPLIKNHDMHEEPIGRVVDANFGPSEFVEDKDTINVTFRVTDNDAMNKFADGRYKTMSIGASVNHITCNLCGKDILKDGKFKFCGHWRGESYKNETASWTTKDLEYKEGSVVNNPADTLAQVKRIRVIKHKDGNSMNKDNEQVLANIDNLIGDGEAKVDDTNVVTDNTDIVEDNVVENNDDVEETTEPTLEDKLAEANAKLSELEDSIETLKSENKELSDKLAEAVSSKEIADGEVVAIKEQAKSLAVFNKQLLADNLKALNNDITDETLEGKTAKEISDMLEEFKQNPVRTPAPKLKNPGATVNDSNTIIEDGENTSSTESVKTMKDMKEVLLKLL